MPWRLGEGEREAGIRVGGQAAILCRNRAEPRLPEVTVDVSPKRYRLVLPEGWLERRPLTRRALEEGAYWQAVGMKYAFG